MNDSIVSAAAAASSNVDPTTSVCMTAVSQGDAPDTCSGSCGCSEPDAARIAIPVAEGKVSTPRSIRRPTDSRYVEDAGEMFRPRGFDDSTADDPASSTDHRWSLSQSQSLVHKVRVVFVGGLALDGGIRDVVNAAHAIRFSIDILRICTEDDRHGFRVLRQLTLSSSITSDAFHGNYDAVKLSRIAERADFIVADGCDVYDRLRGDLPKLADDLWCYHSRDLPSSIRRCEQSIHGVAELADLFGVP